VADKQIPTTQLIAEEGRLLYLGDRAEVSAAAIAHVTAGLLETPNWVARLARRSAELVDGRGAARVARYFSTPDLRLRRARLEDCRAVHEWRNDERTRQNSHDSRFIPYEEHERWYHQSLTNPNRVLLIGEVFESPIGVLRYDLEQDKATVSIHLAPEWRGHGLGAQLLCSGSDWMRTEHPALREVYAEILFGNQASHAAFTSAGYSRYCSIYRLVF
jgi:RimJ/RimL family protein N-acetyltransferase